MNENRRPSETDIALLERLQKQGGDFLTFMDGPAVAVLYESAVKTMLSGTWEEVQEARAFIKAIKRLRDLPAAELQREATLRKITE